MVKHGRGAGGKSYKKKLKYKKQARTRSRLKDLDQIQDEYKAAMNKPNQSLPIDLDLPGLGQYYCFSCAKYFIDQNALDAHNKSKVHKRRLKQVLTTKQYTQQEADEAAGMGKPDNGRDDKIIKDIEMK